MMLADILFSMVGPLLSLYIPRAVSSPFIVFSFVHNISKSAKSMHSGAYLKYRRIP